MGVNVDLCKENDHVLRAIESLYRFVTIQNPVELAEYVRHLRDAINVLEAAGASGGAARRMEVYRRWLASLSYAVKELVSS